MDYNNFNYVINTSDIIPVAARSVDVWPGMSHVMKLHEEMAELQVAMHHYALSKASQEEVATEAADVILTLQTFMLLMGKDFSRELQEQLRYKTNRLEKRLDAYQKKEEDR